MNYEILSRSDKIWDDKGFRNEILYKSIVCALALSSYIVIISFEL